MHMIFDDDEELDRSESGRAGKARNGHEERNPGAFEESLCSWIYGWTRPGGSWINDRTCPGAAAHF